MTREEKEQAIADMRKLKAEYMNGRKLDAITDRKCKSFDIAIEALEEPKTGRWIPVTNGRGGHECEQCHEYAPSYQNGEEYLSKHCPGCGIRMESEGII